MLAIRKPQPPSSASRPGGAHVRHDASSLPSSSRRSNASCRLSFYDAPPAVDVDVESFETYGIARLQVLRRIDVLQARGVKQDQLDAEVNKADLEHLFGGGDGPHKDLISHYVLRMAYCRTEELRHWFLANECLLFKIRFEAALPSDVDGFLRERKMLLKYPPISHQEKQRLMPKLMGVHQNSGATEHGIIATDYYKVPFQDVPQLVSRREVFVERGHAYVSRSRILSIVEGKFRTSLSKGLARAQQISSQWSADPRIGPTVSRLSRVAYQYGGSTGRNALSSDGTLDALAVSQIFSEYLTSVMGHSSLKMKAAGVNKMFISTGTRKANECDRRCPIAGRVHKSNTQKYTIFFDTLVMQQGCWDGVCQATGKHVYYQIRDDGRCVKVGWDPPPVDAKSIAAAVARLSGGGVPSNGAEKGKVSIESTSTQVKNEPTESGAI